MARIVNEQTAYSREMLERMAKNYAMLAIVDRIYVGTFHSQTTEWKPDGSVVVVTSHEPGSMEDWRKSKKVTS